MTSGKEYLFKEMGLFFKKHRERSGLTQKQLAERIGMNSAQFISNCERGLCAYPDKFLPLVAKETGVDMDKLLRMLVKNSREYYKQQLRH